MGVGLHDVCKFSSPTAQQTDRSCPNGQFLCLLKNSFNFSYGLPTDFLWLPMAYLWFLYLQHTVFQVTPRTAEELTIYSSALSPHGAGVSSGRSRRVWLVLAMGMTRMPNWWRVETDVISALSLKEYTESLSTHDFCWPSFCEGDNHLVLRWFRNSIKFCEGKC